MGMLSVCVTLDVKANTRPVRRTNSSISVKRNIVDRLRDCSERTTSVQNRRTDPTGDAESTVVASTS